VIVDCKMLTQQSHSALACNILVLNKHYMAVRIISVKRAFSLLFKDLAEVVSVEDNNYANYYTTKTSIQQEFFK